MSQFGRNNPYQQNVGSGGGGYLPGSPFGSSSGSPGGFGERPDAAHSLRPVTIGQICRATQAHTDAEWRIDDIELGQVTVVAQVISIQSQATNSVYWLDDGTGRIEARHWVDSSNEADGDKWEGITENAYVRATGGLKTFGSKRYINASHIRPSKDPHELYFHIMEAMVVNLIFERGPPPMAGGDNAGAAGTPGQAVASAYTSHSTGSGDMLAKLPNMQRSIIEAILAQPRHGDEGVHVAAIARAIGGDPHLISAAIEKLMEEGLVFSTIDDSHFDVTQR